MVASVEARRILELLEERVAGTGDVELWASLCLVAGEHVDVGEAELLAARRRAVLLLAAGGDPARDVGLDDRAVTALADELDRPERRAALLEGLAELRSQAAGLASVREALVVLAGDRELAWRALACALLAEELADG